MAMPVEVIAEGGRPVERILGLMCYVNGNNAGSGKVLMDKEHLLEGIRRCLRCPQLGRTVQELDGANYALYFNPERQRGGYPVYPLKYPGKYGALYGVLRDAFVMLKAGAKETEDESLDQKEYKKLSMRMRTKAAEAISYVAGDAYRKKLATGRN